jgi:hypothetical protein
MKENKIRHDILRNLVLSVAKDGLPVSTPFRISDINKGSFDTKENFALNYLIATEHLDATPKTGIATAVALTEKGKNAYYSEYFLEIYRKYHQRWWTNFVTLFFSGAITIATIVQVWIQIKTSDKKDELLYTKEINNINTNLQEIKFSLDQSQTTLAILLDSMVSGKK